MMPGLRVLFMGMIWAIGDMFLFAAGNHFINYALWSEGAKDGMAATAIICFIIGAFYQFYKEETE